MNRTLLKILFYILLTIAALTFIYPFIWMIISSFKPEFEITELSLLPSKFTLESYEAVFKNIPIIRAFLNSVLVSTSITASVVFFSSMVGYALSRLRFRGRDAIFYLILFTMMIPFQITLIPMYILIVKFGWVDSYQALIVPYMISAFGVLLFRQYFKSFPQDIIDAARLDGCSEFTIILKIVWPNSVPAIITVGIITFMSSWNEVLWPLIVIKEDSYMTMPQMVTLFSIGGRAEARIGAILASATLLAIPVIFIYTFFQRYFIESMATTGLKG